MSHRNQPEFQLQYGLSLHEIVFCQDAKDPHATLFASYQHPVSGADMDRDLGCDFSMLTDLLQQAGNQPDEPISLDVCELLHGPLTIKDVRLRIYKPLEQDDSGAWVAMQDEYYFIDALHPLSPAEQQAQAAQESFAALLLVVDGSYRQYKAWRQLGFSKKQARARTGLQDQVLFDLARRHHQIIHSKA